MTTTAYIVVKFFGNTTTIGSQQLDQVFFVEADARKRAERMQKRRNWIWRVLPVEIDLQGEQQRIREEFAARGVKL